MSAKGRGRLPSHVTFAVISRLSSPRDYLQLIAELKTSKAKGITAEDGELNRQEYISQQVLG